MPLRKKHAFAWMMLVICAISSIFGLSGMHLRSIRAEALEVFFCGAAGDSRHSMDSCLNRSAGCARIMASEALQYLGEDNPDAARMLANIKFMGSENSMNDRYAAYIGLQKDADALYNAMHFKNLMDAERAPFRRAYDEFWDYEKHIRKNAYHSMAEDYNSLIASFPANAVSAVIGAEQLNNFRF